MTPHRTIWFAASQLVMDIVTMIVLLSIALRLPYFAILPSTEDGQK